MQADDDQEREDRIARVIESLHECGATERFMAVFFVVAGIVILWAWLT